MKMRLRSPLLRSIILGLALSAVGSSAVSTQESLPTVDLGYQIHQASKVQDGVFTFANIRYAAPPLGKRRFSDPQDPPRERGKLFNGTEFGDTTCYQSNPAWSVPVNGSREGLDPLKYIYPPITKGSEDCLFLDVLSPTTAFNQKSGSTKGKGLPVVVWIHGGGWAQGSKNWYGSLEGLVNASGNGIVVVQVNYRLAAFGFLNGPSYRIAGGTPNLGLLDQRFAMKWVQKHIRRFGGDPSRVTIMGHSAGGGAVIHHITAFGGQLKNERLFSQAISLSPGWNPTTSHLTAEKTFVRFAAAAGCASGNYTCGISNKALECLRGKSSEELLIANQAVVAKSVYGTYSFSPSADGTLVPDMATNLLLYGQFNDNVRLLTGQVTDEAQKYTNPSTNASLIVPEAVAWAMPHVDPAIVDLVGEELYPMVEQGSSSSLPYKTNLERAALMVAEFGFVCNNAALHKAFRGNSHAYVFGIPPATHAADILYLFDTPLTPKVANTTAFHTLRGYLSNFILSGDPNEKKKENKEKELIEFPEYGSVGNVIRIDGPESIKTGTDPAKNERCDWWQQTLYLN